MRSILKAYTGELPDTALRYVLEALLPYSRANLTLAFSPNRFFNDLDAIGRFSRPTLRNAYYSAKRSGYFELTKTSITLTHKAHAALQPYQPSQLSGSHLLVIFDIPEQYANQRRMLRTTLRELSFTPIQKSVWTSRYDSRAILTKITNDLAISRYVEIFEAVAVE